MAKSPPAPVFGTPGVVVPVVVPVVVCALATPAAPSAMSGSAAFWILRSACCIVIYSRGSSSVSRAAKSLDLNTHGTRKAVKYG